MRHLSTRAAAHHLGFTLLEVMIALALLAAGMMAISDLVGSALRNHGYAQDLSVATLLARAKMAELEQKYEDQGFTDFDQEEKGDFSAEGRSDIHWEMKLVKPNSHLSPDQLFAGLAGGGDPQELLSKLMGGGSASGSAQSASSTSASAPTTSTTSSPEMAVIGKLLQTQLTAFGESIKTTFREMRLTISFGSASTPRSFTVITHLLVLNPRAPNGVRGDNPDIPASLLNVKLNKKKTSSSSSSDAGTDGGSS